MNFVRSAELYETLPLWVKKAIAVLPYPVMAGRAYQMTYARGARLDRASREDLVAYQERQLGELLRFAVEHVPIYREHRAAVQRLRPLEALKEFAIIDKAFVVQHSDDFLADSLADIPHHWIKTGGTGATRLALCCENNSPYVEMAFVHRHWSQMGYSYRSRKATFRRRMGAHPAGVYWEDNPVYHERRFSVMHLSESNLPLYFEALRRYLPEYLHGYPSAIDLVAGFILRTGAAGKLHGIKAAFLTSEGITEAQRARIETAFNTRVFSFYGHSERLVFGGECVHSSAYHHPPDYGVLELLGENGESCSQVGEAGEIVGTTLWNRCMPLIRYRTGDFARRLAPCCLCGRHYDRFDQVEGRRHEDVIVGRTGVRFCLSALNDVSWDRESLVRFQFCQERPGVCTLRVMTTPGFTEKDRQGVQAALGRRFGRELEVVVEVVREIPLTAGGKLRPIVPMGAGCGTDAGQPAPV